MSAFSPQDPSYFINPDFLPMDGAPHIVSNPATLEAVGRRASATEAEIDSVLVLSGVSRREDLVAFPYSPAYILAGVGEIAGAV